VREYYFPAFLDLRGRTCVVVGGGEVARGKVLGLLPCGARVRVVSPELHPDLERLARRGRIDWVARPYRPGDLAGAALAVAATDDTALNDAVRAEAVAERVLINVVDVPDKCDFVYGAVFRRGRLTAAISTGGASPAYAARLKRELARVWGSEHGRLVSAFRRLRPYVMARIGSTEARKRFWLELVAREEALEMARTRRAGELDAWLRAEVDGWVARSEATAGVGGEALAEAVGQRR
jgi:precorrin-2 dehydrogenase/sirohydrochlorin ferrochelatase